MKHIRPFHTIAGWMSRVTAARREALCGEWRQLDTPELRTLHRDRELSALLEKR